MTEKINAIIRSIRLEFAWLFFRRPFLKPAAKGCGSRFLILPGGGLRPGERKSFGDEMMFLAVCRHIDQTNPRAKITVLRYEGTAGRAYDFYGYRVGEIAFPSFSHVSPSAYRQFRSLVVRYTDVYLIGADCLDGAYWRRQTIQMLRFMHIAGRSGCRARILGFSYNGNKDRFICRELRRASDSCILCVRDPVSSLRLSGFGVQNRVEVADLAFPVDARQYPFPEVFVPIRQQLEAWKKEGAVIVAVNLCGWHWDNLEAYVDRFARRLTGLFEAFPAIRYLLLPHDNREGKISDGHTLSLLNDKLDACRDRVVFCKNIASGVHAKQLVGYADALLTGRMHLAIAALSQGTPTISLMYQGKFEGLYGHYLFADRYYFDPDDLDGLFEALGNVLGNRDGLSQQIRSRNKEIFRLSERNFFGLPESQTENKDMNKEISKA